MSTTTIKTLPCKLSDYELAAKGDELAQKTSELDGLRKEKAEQNSLYSGQIKGLEKEVLRIAHQMSRKVEDREVQCEDRPDWTTGIMETYRTDTDERIAYRLLTPEERQGHLTIVPIDRAAGEQS